MSPKLPDPIFRPSRYLPCRWGREQRGDVARTPPGLAARVPPPGGPQRAGSGPQAPRCHSQATGWRGLGAGAGEGGPGWRFARGEGRRGGSAPVPTRAHRDADVHRLLPARRAPSRAARCSLRLLGASGPGDHLQGVTTSRPPRQQAGRGLPAPGRAVYSEGRSWGRPSSVPPSCYDGWEGAGGRGGAGGPTPGWTVPMQCLPNKCLAGALACHHWHSAAAPHA